MLVRRFEVSVAMSAPSIHSSNSAEVAPDHRRTQIIWCQFPSRTEGVVVAGQACTAQCPPGCEAPSPKSQRTRPPPWN